MIFIFVIILGVTSVTGVKLGYIYEDSPTSSLDLVLLEDFKNILNFTGIEHLPDFFNISTQSDGSQINNILSIFQKQNIAHIFSPIIFKDMDYINSAFSNHSMTLWSTTPYIVGKCHSNIIHFGSITKTIERSIFFFVYYNVIVMIYYSEVKPISLIFQKSYYADEIEVFIINLADILGITFNYIEIENNLPNNELNTRLTKLNSSTDLTELFVIADFNTISTKLIIPLSSMTQFEILIIDLDDFTYHNNIPNTPEWNNVLILLPSDPQSTDYNYNLNLVTNRNNDIPIMKLY